MSANLLEELSQLLGPLGSLGPLALVMIIFLNNALKALGVIVLGILLGLPPLLFICLNGFIIGVLVSALKPVAGYGVIVAGLAPHGVIEVPVLLISTALGLAVGWESLRWITGRKSQVRRQLRWGLKVYLRWILLALFIAAVIEVFVTPFIVGLAGGGELNMR
jgi:stage II sporulation protein M